MLIATTFYGELTTFRYCSNYLMYINLFYPYHNPMGQFYYSLLFTNKETEAARLCNVIS